MKDILYFNTLEDIKLTDMMRLSKSKEHDYSKDYLTFEALEDGTFTLNIPANVDSTYMTSVSYSTDDGENWTTTTVDNTAQTITTPTINAGDKVLWKGVGKAMGKSETTNNYSVFSATGNFDVKGNIMSMLYGDNFLNQVAFPSDSTYSFTSMFYNNKKLKSAESLILPATTLVDRCYYYMFSGCTALTTAPVLSSTTLATRCYGYMFNGCASLTTAPELPATIMANGCYWGMFAGCSGLTTPPILSSTTLAIHCYRLMFNGCTSLTTAPELPATTTANYCYRGMFYGCKSLTTAPEIKFTTMGAETCTEMFYGCKSLTTAPALPATRIAQNCYESMFAGCTALTTAPELPATTLAKNCYDGMFYNCTALTTAPVLPATTLTQLCYQYMFQGCKNLNYIKAMFTTTPSTSYTNNWVQGVAATGTFVKNSAAEWDVTGVNGIPTGWTVETADS